MLFKKCDQFRNCSVPSSMFKSNACTDRTNVVSEGLQTLQGLKHNDGLLE